MGNPRRVRDAATRLVKKAGVRGTLQVDSGREAVLFISHVREK
jgi:hypothetical protein